MFTLKSLVDDAALELRVLVADSPGALEDPVVWVHNTELPDPSTYLRKGELVLTNGLWADQVTPAEFVANVRRAGAVGIVFGLRPDTLATPPGLIEACLAAGMPLLEISPAVPFTAISEWVAARYTEERQRALVGQVRRGDALAVAISRGAGASGVLRVLRDETDL
ncbi:MAG TPA: PucR family transcriptional regulator ligand-binding domain-containing protein, partial [Thermopolyspora sp.]